MSDGRVDDSRITEPKGFNVERRRAFFGSSISSSCNNLLEAGSGWSHAPALNSDRDSVSPRLCTPYMLSLRSPWPSGIGSESNPEACGLCDRKKVAGAVLRGSRDGEGGSKEDFREKDGRSGTGRMVET